MEHKDLPAFIQEQIERAQASRNALKQKRSEEAQQKAALKGAAEHIPEGETKIRRTIQTGTALGSEAFHRPPENIVIGRRKDFDTGANRPAQPVSPEDEG